MGLENNCREFLIEVLHGLEHIRHNDSNHYSHYTCILIVSPLLKQRYLTRSLHGLSLFSSRLNPLVPELFCHKFDQLEIVSFLCTFLQHAVR